MSFLREFEDLESFAIHLAARELALRERLANGLEEALVILEKDMKDQVGHYQDQVGQFPAWAPLADSTEAEKARLGAPAEAPLLRHGALYASFEHSRSGDEGVVGSTDPTMVYHEFGTDRMPPRPIIGPAVVRNRERIERLFGKVVLEGILGGEVVPDGRYFEGGD